MANTNNADRRCPACGKPTDLGSLDANDDATALSRQADQLRLLLDQLEREQVTPIQVEEMLPDLCGACQGMLTGLTRLASKGEIESRIQDQIDALSEQARLLSREEG